MCDTAQHSSKLENALLLNFKHKTCHVMVFNELQPGDCAEI